MQWTRSLPDTLEILAMNSMRSAMPAALPGDSGTEFTYGVGLDWRATDVLNVTLEYQSSGVDYDALRFGLGVRF